MNPLPTLRIRQTEMSQIRFWTNSKTFAKNLLLTRKEQYEEKLSPNVSFKIKTVSKTERFLAYIRGKFLAFHKENEPESASRFPMI
jgi:hypothetical protein